jgi:hypothetical protein
MSEPSGAQDPDSGADARDGEHSQYRKNQRHGTYSTDHASEPDAPLPPRERLTGITDWDVDEERVELSVGPGRVKRFKSFFEFVSAEPPLSGCVPKPLCRLLPISI